jgi:hypothetical protein
MERLWCRLPAISCLGFSELMSLEVEDVEECRRIT